MGRPKGSKNKEVVNQETVIRNIVEQQINLRLNQLVQEINAALQSQMDETVKGLNQVHDIIMRKINGEPVVEAEVVKVQDEAGC